MIAAKLRTSIARWIAPPGPNGRIAIGSAMGGFTFGKRMYASARTSRLTAGWTTSNASADSELTTSLTNLRTRSRALVRDAAYAKRAKVVVVNNVVGSGIGMQAQVMTSSDKLNERVNDDIENTFEDWCAADSCHTGGTLHFADLERAGMGQVFDAGEIMFRKHYRPFGRSRIPFALEMIEAERIADELTGVTRQIQVQPGNLLRMGVEVDSFFRPVAYWLHQSHQGEVFVGEQARDQLERVPAEQIIHLRIVDRWPQTRGEPWLHAVVRKLQDMDGYSEAEIIAARGAASYMGSIETPEGTGSVEGEEIDDGTQQVELTPGIFEKLAPGEKMNFFAPNRPNSALDPFMRYMLREVAAGVGVSYESLSRDYSQSNYSSSRLALLDDRDLWRMLQQWFIRSFREEIHREWLRQAVFARAVATVSVEQYAADPAKYEAVRFKPRGWSWIDPQKEAEARKIAVRCGFDTMTNVIAETGNGRDLEDILRERDRELKMAEAYGLDFDTDVLEPVPAAETTATPNTEADMPSEDLTAGTQAAKQARIMRALEQALSDAHMRGEARGREDQTAEAIASIARAVEAHPAPTVHVAQPTINVAAPNVTVEAARAPDVRIEPTVVNVAPPTVNVEPTVVNVAPPSVTVEAARAPDVRVEAPIVHVAPPNITVAETPGTVQRRVTEWTKDGLPKTVEITPENGRKRTRTVTEWTDDGMPKTVEEFDEEQR